MTVWAGSRVRTCLTTAAVLVAAACGPAAPAATPPPAPDAAVLTRTWAATDVPSISDGTAQAVAFGPSGFVAVGGVTGWRQDPNGGKAGFPLRPVVLHSPDGLAWTPARLDFNVQGVSLEDVAAGPDGYVAVGGHSAGVGETRMDVLWSADGLTWEPVVLPGPGANAFPWRVAWTGEAFIVSATAYDKPAAVELVSADGRTWTSRDVEYQRALVPTSAGWLGIGPTDAWTTPDLEPWEADALTWPQEGWTVWAPERGAVTPGGTILAGSIQSPCGPFSDCTSAMAAWWSADARHWVPLPVTEVGWRFFGSRMGVHRLGGGEGEAVYVNDRDTWASVDGWRWQPLVNGAVDVPSGQAVMDLVVGDGVVVLVGQGESPLGGDTPGVVAIDAAIP